MIPPPKEARSGWKIENPHGEQFTIIDFVFVPSKSHQNQMGEGSCLIYSQHYVHWADIPEVSLVTCLTRCLASHLRWGDGCGLDAGWLDSSQANRGRHTRYIGKGLESDLAWRLISSKFPLDKSMQFPIIINLVPSILISLNLSLSKSDSNCSHGRRFISLNGDLVCKVLTLCKYGIDIRGSIMCRTLLEPAKPKMVSNRGFSGRFPSSLLSLKLRTWCRFFHTKHNYIKLSVTIYCIRLQFTLAVVNISILTTSD